MLGNPMTAAHQTGQSEAMETFAKQGIPKLRR